MVGEEVADEGGGVLAELFVVGAEGGWEVAIDVQLSDDLAGGEDGDYDFGFGFKRAGEVARVVVDIIDDDGPASGGGGTADSLVELDAGVRRHGAAKGSEDEYGRCAGKFLNHVEADPVVAKHVFMKELDDAFEKVIGGFGRGDKIVEFIEALQRGEGSPHGWSTLP